MWEGVDLEREGEETIIKIHKRINGKRRIEEIRQKQKGQGNAIGVWEGEAKEDGEQNPDYAKSGSGDVIGELKRLARVVDSFYSRRRWD